MYICSFIFPFPFKKHSSPIVFWMRTTTWLKAEKTTRWNVCALYFGHHRATQRTSVEWSEFGWICGQEKRDAESEDLFFLFVCFFFHLMEHLKHLKYLQHLEHFVPFPWFDSRSFSVTPGCAQPCAVLLWEVWTACDRLRLAIYRASYCGSTWVLNVMPWGQAV